MHLIIFNVPICKVSHIKDAIFLLKQHEIKIYGASEKSETEAADDALITNAEEPDHEEEEKVWPYMFFTLSKITLQFFLEKTLV